MTFGTNSPKARWTIGFLTAHFADFRFYGTWTGIADVMRERGANLICFPAQDIASESAMRGNMAAVLQELLNPAMIDGLITHQWWSSPQWFEQVCSRYRPLPIVTIFRQYPGYPGASVDNYQGMGEAVRHLIEEHGYRRIAYLRGPEGTSADERYRGYQDALKHSHIPFDAAIVMPGNHTKTSGATAVRLLLDERKLRPGTDIEAIVASSDHAAIGALEELQHREIQIPHTIALVGFDGETWTSFTTPPLTTTAVPWYELGRKAAEELLALLEGREVPELIIVPTQLVIRRSCGCIAQDIKQAAVGLIRPAHTSFEAACTDQRDAILAALRQVGGYFLNALSGWAERLLGAFVADVTAEALDLSESGAFLPTLEDVLFQVEQHGDDVEIGNTLISELRQHLLPALTPHHPLLARADDLWQQSRVLISTLVRQVQMRRQAKADQQITIIRELGQLLISTFDVMALMETLMTGLPRLAIPGAYLSVYGDAFPSRAWARLLLAYNEQGRIALEQDNPRFSSIDLLPEGMLRREHPWHLVVEPLFFGNEHLGFILFEIGLRDGSLYDILRGEISSALQGALLVQRVQAHIAEIVRKNYILDTFMANVPDSIYFKDRESRIIRSNLAHARLFEVHDPTELIGKSDFDFFPEAQARPKYEQEQAIIRTGQPVLDLEEPDAGGRWSLTTKMPLRDEHGEIVGTFGISRDITELKQAQHELAAAYEEVRILNNQLKDENLQMHTEMDIARRIQTALLPQAVTHLHPDFEIAAVMLPAEEVGGDYYDITLDREGTLWFGIGDVSGHGVTPGLIMMMAQTVHTTITSNFQASARDIVNMVNIVLFKNVHGRLGEDHFMTFATLKYLGNGRFQHAGAHLDLIVYRQQRGMCELIDTPGAWLNFVPDISNYTENREFSVEIGDVLVLYTDGLTEAFSPQNEMLDIHGFVEIVATHAELEVGALRDAIMADVLAWCHDQRKDDMSLVVVRRIQ